VKQRTILFLLVAYTFFPLVYGNSPLTTRQVMSSSSTVRSESDVDAPHFVNITNTTEFYGNTREDRVHYLDHKGHKEASMMVKKKIQVKIFSSRGGGGHTSASKAIFEILKDTCDVHTANLITEVLSSLDIVRKLTLNHYAAEDLYNLLLQGRWIWQLNQMAALGTWQISYNQHAIEQLIIAYLEEQRPDCVISVVPFFNDPLMRACQFLNIPFIIVPTDLDETYFVMGLKPPYYDKFAYTISFNDQEILQRIENAQIPNKFIHPIGFPVRPSFSEKKDIDPIKEAFNVPKDKPVVMLLMGAAGSSATYSYLKQIIKIKTPMHILVCLGRNEELRDKITTMRLPKHITFSIIGFTDKISDLMAISTVLITKSGSVSVCEAIQMHVPLLLEGTRSILWWEQLNHSFICKHQFGDVIRTYRDLARLLPKYLTDTAFTTSIKERMAIFSSKQSFSLGIKNLVDKLVARKVSPVVNSRRHRSSSF
jgi:processive 1,2-diacylglycerol beta-glucosyltransferase